MTRYHLTFRGRIIRSVDAPDGDAAEAAFGPHATPATKIILDADWRALQHRGRLIQGRGDARTLREREITATYERRARAARIRRKLYNAMQRIARRERREALLADTRRHQ